MINLFSIVGGVDFKAGESARDALRVEVEEVSLGYS